ncbi:hypothetical protein [Massilia timonae]|uniref:hypothetical protein n=1 Tax=Massilia timonae TaxID=47229 RepID=UPI0012FC7F5E|nr:hypothetical protein [Massilia timonae]
MHTFQRISCFAKALAWGPARPPTQRFFVLRSQFMLHGSTPYIVVVAAFRGLFGFELC